MIAVISAPLNRWAPLPVRSIAAYGTEREDVSEDEVLQTTSERRPWRELGRVELTGARVAYDCAWTRRGPLVASRDALEVTARDQERHELPQAQVVHLQEALLLAVAVFHRS